MEREKTRAQLERENDTLRNLLQTAFFQIQILADELNLPPESDARLFLITAQDRLRAIE